jgi:hypothetical protein
MTNVSKSASMYRRGFPQSDPLSPYIDDMGCSRVGGEGFQGYYTEGLIVA